MRAKSFFVLILALPFMREGNAIQTERVQLGRNGTYDGTVWITRDSSGSLVMRDQPSGTSVTLQELREGRSDHGGLIGLGDDDHTQYLNTLRHWIAHLAAFNDELPIPPDVNGNVTLGGHTSDSDSHVRRQVQEIIPGPWRFTGQPVIEGTLHVEAAPLSQYATIQFGGGFLPPQFRYVTSLDEFNFTRAIQATSASMLCVEAPVMRVSDTLDGAGASGLPAAALVNFASLNGIASANLLDRSKNEDIAGQWDFLTNVNIFGDALMGKATAHRILLTTQTEAAEYDGLARIETSSPTLRIVLDRNGNYNGTLRKLQITDGERGIAASSPCWEWAQDGNVGYMYFRSSTGIAYLRFDVDSNGAYMSYHGQNGFYAFYNGDLYAKLYSADGSDYFRIRDSNNTDRWTCNSKGDVAMTANARQTIPDGTDGPFILTFNAATEYYLDSIETLSPNQVSHTALRYGGSGDSYVAFPVPQDVYGANVVLDRITIYCSQQGGTGESISSIALLDDSGASVRSYSNSITGTTQWLSSDYTMSDSSSYVIRMTFSSGSSGYMDVVKFKVEYHLE